MSGMNKFAAVVAALMLCAPSVTHAQGKGHGGGGGGGGKGAAQKAEHAAANVQPGGQAKGKSDVAAPAVVKVQPPKAQRGGRVEANVHAEEHGRGNARKAD